MILADLVFGLHFTLGCWFTLMGVCLTGRRNGLFVRKLLDVFSERCFCEGSGASDGRAEMDLNFRLGLKIQCMLIQVKKFKHNL